MRFPLRQVKCIMLEVCLEAENGKSIDEFNGQFPFFPAANFLTVTIPATAVDHYVWDPKGFEFRSLTSYTTTWRDFYWWADPGQSWCVNYYLSNECSIIYNCILFTCPSIAYYWRNNYLEVKSNTYTLVGYYYDIKHEVLAANFKHTSILNLRYMIVLATLFLEWKVVVLRSGYRVKFQVEQPSAGYTFYVVIEMCMIAGDLVEDELLTLVIDTSIDSKGIDAKEE
ncbi:hypothetical protein H5410_042358 [Solanum commersonii]|uniref:Uncharacterized protein n=1 Tax=Solanum commersonii TaxID=4109 RepID=A0A9J5XXD4_SOLCO|nr:hypothetical protein H5410_042358 [Solanum commersonii]